LQESCIQHNTEKQAFANHIGQQLNMTITNLAVSFMNTAGVMSVVKVLVNFQIQIALDLLGYMECRKQINFDLDVKNV
jgi:hypothetical protein